MLTRPWIYLSTWSVGQCVVRSTVVPPFHHKLLHSRWRWVLQSMAMDCCVVHHRCSCSVLRLTVRVQFTSFTAHDITQRIPHHSLIPTHASVSLHSVKAEGASQFVCGRRNDRSNIPRRYLRPVSIIWDNRETCEMGMCFDLTKVSPGMCVHVHRSSCGKVVRHVDTSRHVLVQPSPCSTLPR